MPRWEAKNFLSIAIIRFNMAGHVAICRNIRSNGDRIADSVRVGLPCIQVLDRATGSATGKSCAQPKGVRRPYRQEALDIQRPEFVITLYREVSLASRTRPTRVVARIGLSRHSTNLLTVSLLGCKVIASLTGRSTAGTE